MAHPIILLSSTLLLTLAPLPAPNLSEAKLPEHHRLKAVNSTQKRHKITVNVTSMADLKVSEKQRIEQGDVISDRTSQRQKLEAKKRQLEISLSQLSLPIASLAPLPAPNLEQEQVALRKAQLELAIATKALENNSDSPLKQDWLREALEPEKIEQVAKLKEQQVKAAINVEMALARLSEAQTTYQQQKYQHSIQLANQQTNLQKRQLEISSLQEKIGEVDEQIAELVAVQSPYSGRVRRIKILGQNERNITIEITLDVKS